MKARDLTKKLLADACDDLNAIMKLDPPIPTDPENKDVTKATLEADLREAATELKPDDVLKPKTVEVLEALGVEELKVKAEKKEIDKPKSSVEKKQSSSEFAWKFVCDNPVATDEEIQKAIESAGLKRLAESTLSNWVISTKDILNYLKKTGKIQ